MLKQVTAGDLVISEKLKDVDINDKLELNKVLMWGSMDKTVIGRPYVGELVKITAAVEEQFRGGKVYIFKKKRRKNYRRFKGHRQEYTSLRILNIEHSSLI